MKLKSTVYGLAAFFFGFEWFCFCEYNVQYLSIIFCSKQHAYKCRLMVDPAGVSEPDGNVPDLSFVCLLGACSDPIPLSWFIVQGRKTHIQRYSLYITNCQKLLSFKICIQKKYPACLKLPQLFPVRVWCSALGFPLSSLVSSSLAKTCLWLCWREECSARPPHKCCVFQEEKRLLLWLEFYPAFKYISKVL